MDPTRFDALTRSLGTERSRRGVLKALGAATLGALGVATASRGTAAAPGSPGGNSACAHFCHAVFGDTRAAGQCTSQAAHGQGPCSACNANPANYCNNACTDVASDPNNCGACGNVCPGDACNAATCVNGACGTTPANGGGACTTTGGLAGTCQSGTCVATHVCATTGSNGKPCGADGACLDGSCYLAYPNCPSTFGVAANANDANVCTFGYLGGACATTSDCPSGGVCILLTNSPDSGKCLVGYPIPF